LSYSHDPEVGDLLLNEFKITGTQMKRLICGPLGTLGLAKSFPVLKEAKKEHVTAF
jgi:hypothetical protein